MTEQIGRTEAQLFAELRQMAASGFGHTCSLAEHRDRATTVTGLSSSTPNTEKVTAYDAATGYPTVITAKAADGSTAATITTGFDAWGRQITYQPSGEQVTTTGYDSAGRPATITDANGSTTYTYDGIDAAGRTERRGRATKVDVTTSGSTWTSTAAYDATGAATAQKLPGGITQITEFDNAGLPRWPALQR
jgi:YD repeat-containing protein